MQNGIDPPRVLEHGSRTAPLKDGAYGQDGKFIQNEAKLWNRMSTTQIGDHGLIGFCIKDKFKLEKKILV